jgi:predicted membrane protein
MRLGLMLVIIGLSPLWGALLVLVFYGLVYGIAFVYLFCYFAIKALKDYIKEKLK